MNDKKNVLIQWIIGIASLVSGIAIYLISRYVGYVKKFPSNQGEISVFLHDPQNNNSDYITNINKAFQDASTSIKILSRKFVSTAKDFGFIENLENASKRGVSIQLITSMKTDVSTPFFSLKNVEFGVLNRTNFANYIVSDFIIIDNKVFMHVSDFFDTANFSITRLVGLKTDNEKVVEDASRIFTVMWHYVSEEREKLIPPKAMYWPYDFMPVTTNTDPGILADNTSIYLTVSSTKSKINGRIIAGDAVKTILEGKKIKRIIIVASFFELPDNMFIQNSLISSAYAGANVSVLLSCNKEFNKSTKSAGLIAPFSNISIRIGDDNTNFPNLMIVDDMLIFVSDSVTGRVYKNSLGVATIVKGAKAIKPVIDMFESEWRGGNTKSFSEYIDQVYGNN